jgi:phospholipid/cholesterol/gamma-HCH transport system substrate-binding protein
MEIRARYIQMGVFALFVLVAGFAFVYWLNNAGALRDRAVYRVLFEGSVSGLQRGSAVLFNGIRVGEVTRLDLDGAAPRQVHVTIAVSRGVPVRADTLVFIDFQGLTRSPQSRTHRRSSWPTPRPDEACRRRHAMSCAGLTGS